MDDSLRTLLGVAVLLPLLSFFVIWLFANRLGKSAAFIAVSAIGGAGILSFISLCMWLNEHWPEGISHADAHPPHQAPAEGGRKSSASPSDKHGSAGSLPLTLVAAQVPHPETAEIHAVPATGDKPAEAAAESESHHKGKIAYTGEYYTFGEFGPLRITISYYIDALTVVMFCMVTLIATLIHCYAIGYMADELKDVTDHEVTLAGGHHLHRPGRFPRFFQYLSLFCFSMLGLVLAGNIAMVFVFWELVGICSYFLIGFYIERTSASTAANKAFIVNRVGDFGMIIGLLAIWSSLGTFAFGDIERVDAQGNKVVERGIFSQVRPGPDHQIVVPASMIAADAVRDRTVTPETANLPKERQKTFAQEAVAVYRDHSRDPAGWRSSESEIASRFGGRGYGYWLLVVAGIGIFCGCVGKSAQFPLHTWLPDAMEGPTPVSALVHSATMVAAGVYLVGRFYPVFTPEVLLVIATIGCITMLLGATIAFAAVDIKRVLAYSTVSQLGLMMLALGVGGWLAGVMHLITHAFFKSMLFMCSGSVIHAVHTNDLRKMGGLFSKMPVTAITMLIGCLAIAGVAVPFVLGFSGHYSKDAILEQAYSFAHTPGNPAYTSIFFALALGGAALTSCYMFRMWFMTFVGQPRDQERYDHAHESPPVMVLPLVILAVLATAVAWDFRLIGAAIVAGAFFILRGVEKGWFLPAAGGHGHDDHGHGHGHDDHGHAAHAHGHDDHHAAPSEPPLSWSWVAIMLAATIVGSLFTSIALPVTMLDNLSLASLLNEARPDGLRALPDGTYADARGRWVAATWPNEHKSHADHIKVPVTLMATGTWLGGIFLAASLYWWGYLSPESVRRQFAPVYNLLWNKYYFDELYDAIFVQPTLVISRFIALIDKNWIDGLIDFLARLTVWFSNAWDLIVDRGFVDSIANLTATWTYSLGTSLRTVQTGRIRQYVMFIVVGAIAIFVLISFFWSPTLAR
ncbi:MAG: NADH-quinone oxidoreductase subunit L [Planctomycetaceae bacterium]|nr:NADH-quinone oxidoreductase subunit L [Planctomycetaceae bacterium]